MAVAVGSGTSTLCLAPGKCGQCDKVGGYPVAGCGLRVSGLCDKLDEIPTDTRALLDWRSNDKLGSSSTLRQAQGRRSSVWQTGWTYGTRFLRTRELCSNLSADRQAGEAMTNCVDKLCRQTKSTN